MQPYSPRQQACLYRRRQFHRNLDNTPRLIEAFGATVTYKKVTPLYNPTNQFSENPICNIGET